MIAVQRQPNFLPTTAHLRRPQVVVKSTPTPGLLTLSKPAPIKRQQPPRLSPKKSPKPSPAASANNSSPSRPTFAAQQSLSSPAPSTPKNKRSPPSPGLKRFSPKSYHSESDSSTPTKARAITPGHPTQSGNQPQPSSPLPVQTIHVRRDGRTSRSVPVLSHVSPPKGKRLSAASFAAGFPICNDDEDALPTPSTTPLRPRSAPTPRKSGKLSNRPNSGDGVFHMSSDEESSAPVVISPELQALFDKVRSGNSDAFKDAIPFASSTFQNSPEAHDLPPPSF